MQFYDTHAHFGLNIDETRAVLARAREAGVTRLMAVGGSPELNRAACEAHAQAPDDVRLALGADRDQLDVPFDETLSTVRRLHAEHACAAVGEIGLDFHYSPETAARQCELFARQLSLADELNLPVVIHTREADDATCGVLDDMPWHGNGLRGIIHCYTGDPAFARRLLDRGFMISISGIVTFRLADNVRESARYIPDDRLLIETDSPFLAPVPLRGQTNEPAFLTRTAAFLADVRRTAVDALAALTYANAVSLLG
jgi:TatD DNase family protein